MSSKQELAGLLEPMVQDVLKTLDPSDPDAATARLVEACALEGAQVQEIRSMVERGHEEGWLLDKEANGVRFGRVAKDLHGFSIDAVMLETAHPGPRHWHPNGEIDLLFAVDGDPRFDGRHPEGWAVYAPDSVHVPAVTGGAMLILYFLPGGAIEWV